MLVDFISGQLKYWHMSKHNLWPVLTYENHRNYLFSEAPIFGFYEKSLTSFFKNVLMCLLIGLEIF